MKSEPDKTKTYELDESEAKLIRWSLEVAKRALDASESIPGKEKMSIYTALDDLLQEKLR